jgi:hypothetical protein
VWSFKRAFTVAIRYHQNKTHLLHIPVNNNNFRKSDQNPIQQHTNSYTYVGMGSVFRPTISPLNALPIFIGVPATPAGRAVLVTGRAVVPVIARAAAAAAPAISGAATTAARAAPAVVTVASATVVIIPVTVSATTRAVLVPAGTVVIAATTVSSTAPVSTAVIIPPPTIASVTSSSHVAHPSGHELHSDLTLVKLPPVSRLLGTDGLLHRLELHEGIVPLHINAHELAIGLKEHLQVLALGGLFVEVDNKKSLVRHNLLATLVLLALDAAVTAGELDAEGGNGGSSEDKQSIGRREEK